MAYEIERLGRRFGGLVLLGWAVSSGACLDGDLGSDRDRGTGTTAQTATTAMDTGAQEASAEGDSGGTTAGTMTASGTSASGGGASDRGSDSGSDSASDSASEGAATSGDGASSTDAGGDEGTSGTDDACVGWETAVEGTLHTSVAPVTFTKGDLAELYFAEDVDPEEAGCFTYFYIELNVEGGGCMLRLEGDLVADGGRLAIDRVVFEAYSGCPNFSDDDEKLYTGNLGNLTGSWVTLDPPLVPDPDAGPFEACFEMHLHLEGHADALQLGPSDLTLHRRIRALGGSGRCLPRCKEDDHCEPSEYCSLDNECIEGPRYGLRLGGGADPRPLEVLRRGEWRPMCGFGWDDNATAVACRELLGPGATGQASVVDSADYRGWLDDVDCEGTESSIADCGGAWGDSYCTQGRVVNLTCDP